MTRKSRRHFLLATAAASATIALHSAPAQSANSKVRVGLIGCGGRGTHDAGLFQKTTNVDLACICDVDDARRASVAKSLGLASANQAVADLRRILDDKSIDAVCIATPDHWHSP